MFDTVDKYRPVFQVLLGLIGLSFITFGVRSFTQAGSDYIVEIGNQKVSRQDVREALQNQQLPATPENTKQIYNLLIQQAYFINGAKDMGLSISMNQIKQIIMNTPIFQKNGKFSLEKFHTYLQNSVQNETQLTELVRKQFYTRSIFNIATAGNFVSDVQAKTFLDVYQSVRNVQFAYFNPSAYTNQVKVNDADLKKYYQENTSHYTLPEAIKYSYVQISPNLLAKQEKVSDEQIKQYFDEHKGEAPQRDIAHILIAFPENMTSAQKAALKIKAQNILAQVRQNPDHFAQYAQEYSQDYTSAQNGGDLGWTEQNHKLVKPFEEVAFSLPTGKISDLVETPFGYHIIKVLGVLNHTNLANDTPAIKWRLQQQQAKKDLNAMKDRLSEVAFNQSKDLKPVADVVHATIQHKDQAWLTKDQANQILPKAVATALFSDDVMQRGNNSDVINVNGTLWIVRVDKMRSSMVQPFSEVTDQVKADYIHSQAIKLAQQDAQKVYDDLNKGKEVNNLHWSVDQTLSLDSAKAILSSQDLTQFMQALPRKGKPVYLLVSKSPQKDTMLIRINSIKLPNEDEQTSKLILNVARQNLAQQESFSFLQSYLKYLEKKLSVKQGLQRLDTAE